ncbi:MAG: hypothetical protein U1E22_08170 [Coriobacteriia bacterium]|nr:hypothetical protein [Coriobacteriia bacterium]
MSEAPFGLWVGIGLVLFATAGCGGGPGFYAPGHSTRYEGGKVEPASTSERRLLETVERLGSGKEEKVGELVVVADAPYFAASGRLCRSVRIVRGASGATRLACKDGSAWFYAPEVFVSERGR